MLGGILAALGAAVTVFGIRATIKGRRVSAVPFRRPSEILQRGAAAADPAGMVATEGLVSALPLVAPMSARPCLAYELVVERTWEKQVRTDRDVTKQTGKDRLLVERRGSVFQLGDGAGAALIDATGDLEADLERAHASSVPVGDTIPPTLTFGAMTMPTPLFDSTASRTLTFLAAERVLAPAPGTALFALGQLRPGAHGLAIAAPEPPRPAKLLLATRSREALVAGTRRVAVAAYALGAALAATGVAFELMTR